jgi:hypothetical protein
LLRRLGIYNLVRHIAQGKGVVLKDDTTAYVEMAAENMVVCSRLLLAIIDNITDRFLHANVDNGLERLFIPNRSSKNTIPQPFSQDVGLENPGL